MDKITEAHLPGPAAIWGFQRIGLGRRSLSSNADGSQQNPKDKPEP